MRRRVVHIWGDVDCSGEVNPLDRLKILILDAGLPFSQRSWLPGDERSDPDRRGLAALRRAASCFTSPQAANINPS